jgi:hypothetical protein
MQSKYVLKLGQTGDLVRILQELLNINPSGEFDNPSRTTVLLFQKQNKLKADGIVGPLTWLKLNYNPLELESDTDLSTGATWIQQHALPEGEYVQEITNKEWIFLHDTKGRHNPKDVIDQWATDQRGRVGAHYVIGGISAILDINNLSDDESKWDGKILQAIKDEYWGYHLGAVKSSKMHKGSISIELCNSGPLVETDGKFYTWYGTEVHESQVCRLEAEYKGHRYYHKYSKEQLNALKALLLLLSDKHGINLKSGVSTMLKGTTKPGISIYYPIMGSPMVFDYNESANLGKIKGILTHGQVSQNKTDASPQPDLIQLLLNI